MFLKIVDHFSPHLYSLCTLPDLAAGEPSRVATLDVKHRVVHRGPQFFEADRLESLDLLNVWMAKEQRTVTFLALKIKLGPVFCFDRQASDQTTKDLGKSLARRLGLEAPWHADRSSYVLYDGLVTLDKGRITGSVALERVTFTDNGLIFPVGLCVEDEDHYNTSGDLLVDRRDGIVLYNALGQSRHVADFSELKKVRARTRSIALHSSEHSLLTLELVLGRGPRIELTRTYGTVHDEPIRGEAEKARREEREVDRVVDKIRKHIRPERGHKDSQESRD